jgi:hypothetical protein
VSATGRGTKRKRHDAYGTPPWCVWRLLEAVDLPAGRWIEPCAGDGAIIRAVDSKRSDVRWSAVEIRENMVPRLEATGAIVQCRDFLGIDFVDEADVIISNPPYAMAEQVIRKSVELAPIVAMLLRINFLASIERRDWLAEFMPDVFVLPNRPSFTGGPTDATEYAWMLWERDAKRARGLVTILGLTSKEEKKLRV